MMQSMKLMFLGFLVILVGMSWLISLATALPGNGTRTINPVVQAFYQSSFCQNTSPQSFYCTGDPDPAGQLIDIVRTQELFAGFVVLGGLVLGIVGYFRKERPAPPKPPAQNSPEG